MTYQEKYQSKLVSADQAVSCIESGMWLDYGWCAGTPVALDAALARRSETLTDIKIRGGLLLRPLAIADVPNAKEKFTWNSWHASGLERKMMRNGFGFYLPIRYSELPSYYSQITPPDVAMIQVTSMDEHGYFNFGPQCSHIRAMCDVAKKIIVEVNPKMPRCMGGVGNWVHIDEVAAVVECELDMPLMGGAVNPSEVDLAVANLVMPELPNGACLQLGIGSMPGTIGKMIAESDLKDLGVHTEMYVDAFVDMSEAGKITGKFKPFDQNRQGYAFAAGTQKLYDYLDNNLECAAYPVSYMNDVNRVSSIDNFISINGAVDIDLFGQVSSESSGVQHISGAGGQQDFVLGAYLSKGGKSFICCSSSYMDKKTGELKSRIRPTMLEGTVITATRTNLHWLVTEYGKLNVKGLSTWERAEGIINLAHPQFRDELIAHAEKMNIWRRSNR